MIHVLRYKGTRLTLKIALLLGGDMVIPLWIFIVTGFSIGIFLVDVCVVFLLLAMGIRGKVRGFPAVSYVCLGEFFGFSYVSDVFVPTILLWFPVVRFSMVFTLLVLWFLQ